MPMNNRLLVPRSTFTPRSIPNLAAWFDASDLSTLSQTSNGATPVTANDDPVAYWRCKVTGTALTQTTDANRPLWKSAGIGTSAGLEFDGSNDALFATAGALMAAMRNVSGGTLLLSARLTSVGAVNAVLMVFGINTGAGGRVVIQRQTQVLQAAGRRLDVDTLANATSAAILDTAAAVYAARLNYAGTEAIARRNGTTVATNASFQTAGSSSDTDSARVTIGANNASTEPAAMILCEALAYSRALTTAELLRAERYLAGRGRGITTA